MSEPRIVTDPAAARRKAVEMAYSLGVPFWLSPDGRINREGAGERIDPGPGAVPTAHGHGRQPEAAATP